MEVHPVKKMVDLVEPLTRREQEILAFLAEGRSNAEIAGSLSLALSSVKWYAQQIYSKLGVENRKLAVAKGRELGFLEGPGRPAGTTPGLPSGTVTFLFTDIEGSTLLWEQMPEAMRVSVAQHHAILRQSIEANGGQVFQVSGDVFQSVFRQATGGLRAALAAQRALRDAQWGPTGPLKVRMGLHSGPAELAGASGSEAPYQVGHTLTRASHIMIAGYGGQVLLSQEAADLVERELPEGISLLDLGPHHLKGMPRLENLYQLVAADLPHQFPPLATRAANPHNLPAALTSFIGREKEITALQELILSRGARLVTLTGSGGTGKTRLALRVAEQLLEKFSQGVWLVELAPVSDPLLVPRAVAEVLGVNEDPQRSIYQVLAGFLCSRQALLILDNCEHVIGEAAALAAALLQACPQLHILATSREILGVEGEVPFACPSLSLPGGKATAGELAEFEAVRLFVERAQNSSPGFTLTESNALLVARICQRLDGIPLAIELAAARTRLLSLEQISARLDHAFRLLTGGSRSVLPRHQTLKALIDWSYNLLSVEERALLLRLAVFAGEWTLEAAERVCADLEMTGQPGEPQLEVEQILDLLGQLIDKSLIQIEQDPAGEPHYRMLETVRQYARERLAERSGAENLRERYLDYFLDLSLRTQPSLRTREALRWLDKLDNHLDDLRQALEWSLSGSVVKGLGLAAALHWFWHFRNHQVESVEWLEKLLSAEDLLSAESPRRQADWIARGRALYTLNFLAVHSILGDPAQARGRGLESKAIFQNLCDAYGDVFRCDLAIAQLSMAATRQEIIECRQVFQMINDPFHIAECDMQLTIFSLGENIIDEATIYNKEDLRLREEIGDLDGEGFALYLSAIIALIRGEQDRAIELAQKSQSFFELIGNRRTWILARSILRTAAWAQGNYQQVSELIETDRALGKDLSSPTFLTDALSFEGFVAWALKEYERAVLCEQKALEMADDLSFTWKKLPLYVLGRVALSGGDYSLAREHLVKSLTKATSISHVFNDYLAIQALGVLAAAQQQHRRAALLFGAQEAHARWALYMICPVERSEYEQALGASRAALGEEAFTAAWEEGRSLTDEQARQYAEEQPV